LTWRNCARSWSTWEGDLDAFEEIIEQRRAYYQPLLPAIDREFRRLDSQMRLRLEQRDRIEQRLKAMLVAPRPDYLATSEERIISEQIAQLEQKLTAGGGGCSRRDLRPDQAFAGGAALEHIYGI
jgi:hypothetical protein